ncbi:MAG: hypothetical protein ACRD09_04705 [Vicinamibacterales bacterium]
MFKRHGGIALLSLAALAVAASPAAAQYGARPDSTRATGETYHVEAALGFWNPTPSILVSSEQFGIIGSQIDGVADLGFEKSRFTGFNVVLRPALKHKFRLNYTPIKYSAEAVFRRDIIFNGIRYNVGLPVASELKWNAWRIGYEWDFLTRDRWFAGLILEAKITDVEVKLESLLANEFARAQAPIPAIGGIGRFYPVENVSATFELTAFHLPNIDEEYKANYIDWDLYGTVNFSENFGAQVGYRSFDVNYTVERDFGDLVLRGLYVNGVVRF